MQPLTELEQAVLNAIADQVPQHGLALRQQISSAGVVERKNTGAGFYTALSVGGAAARLEAPSPLGDIGAEVAGVKGGMGFLLWLRNGFLHQLEGYTYDGSTSELDLTALRYSKLGPRVHDR